MNTVQQYIDLEGQNPFERWFDKLDDNTQARIVVGVDRLERGDSSSLKGAGSGVFELRFDFGPGYRVYLGKDGVTLVILLGGGTKKRQRADINAAHELWQEYKKRKRDK